jgi:hypothetical protein
LRPRARRPACPDPSGSSHLNSFTHASKSEHAMSHEQYAISPPALVQRGGSLTLEIDGRPFLILGGELHNSSSK